MKKHLLVSFFLTANAICLQYSAFSQAPLVEWQNTIGGLYDDVFGSMIQTGDGGFIVAGDSKSGISGDKTIPAFGDSDFWILKLSEGGEIQWQKVYGGTLNEENCIIQQTFDGGYILGGYSGSNISGSKSQNSRGGDDYWIVKIDSLGEIEWDKTIGGSGGDHLHEIVQTNDGGYIVGGTSTSGISGDKTEINYGIEGDIWILKLNSVGEIEWQNTIGGMHYETVHSIRQTSDGGYICGGPSQSAMSVDKSENNIGGLDYWVFKLDSLGNIVWDNTIGGIGSESLYSVRETEDSGFLLGGYSASGVAYDKTEANMGEYGTNDYWIIKINSVGDLEWQNTIGGDNDDLLYNLEITDENEIIICGVSYSGISGDKTDAAFGWGDYWIMKLDETGTILWQKTLGGSFYDYPTSIIQTFDGGFIVGGFSSSGISGNKTEPCVGYKDYWIVKLACDPSSEICNSLDDNCNGLIDDGVIESISVTAAGPTTFCQGGSVVLNASYTGATVQWAKNGTNIPGATSASFTATIKGNYTCTTTSACGSATSPGIYVMVYKNPSATITAGGPTTFCAGGSVVLTANTGAGLSYQWYKNGTSITGATSINYTATTAGTYKCRVTKIATGCNKLSAGIIVTVPCRDSEFTDNSNTNDHTTIFPNPNNGTFTISVNDLASASSPLERGRGVSIEIYNSLGQLIFSKHINSSGEINETIELNQPKGIYFARLTDEKNQVEMKFIVQ